jgi:hypothetical protein
MKDPINSKVTVPLRRNVLSPVLFPVEFRNQYNNDNKCSKNDLEGYNEKLHKFQKKS